MLQVSRVVISEIPIAIKAVRTDRQSGALVAAFGHRGAGNSGTVFSALFAPRLAEHFGWRAVFGLSIGPLLMVLAVFSLVAKDGPSKVPPKRLGSYLKILKESDCWRLSGFYMVTAFIW